MGEKIEIIGLIQSRQILEQEIEDLIYGTVEIREKNKKKYVYIHYRDEGIPLTRYVGEYSDELYNLILSNNKKAKEIKTKLKEIDKKLSKLNYIDKELTEKVKISIDLAKKNMTNTIYKQARLEGIATTYANTETLIEGGKVKNLTSEEVLKIINLKHAWEFILNKSVILSDTNFILLREINKIVQEGLYYSAGEIRNTPATIGGTNWQPEFPVETVIKEELDKIFNKKINDLDRAIELLLYVAKKQIFIDGNKRTAVIYANHYLISKGKGIIVIPVEKIDKFRKLLIAYYEGKDNIEIKKFLKEKCLIKIKDAIC